MYIYIHVCIHIFWWEIKTMDGGLNHLGFLQPATPCRIQGPSHSFWCGIWTFTANPQVGQFLTGAIPLVSNPAFPVSPVSLIRKALSDLHLIFDLVGEIKTPPLFVAFRLKKSWSPERMGIHVQSPLLLWFIPSISNWLWLVFYQGPYFPSGFLPIIYIGTSMDIQDLNGINIRNHGERNIHVLFRSIFLPKV